MAENQNIEYKESWRDEYLGWICAFANSQGGKLYIGVNDKGEVVGVSNSHRLLEDIPNKIVTVLGLVCDINLLTEDGKEYLEIVVEASNVPISFKGEYHVRSGATKQVLKGTSLQYFLLKKNGLSWDDIASTDATIDFVDRKAIEYFLRKGIESGRISSDLENESTQTVLENFRLLTPDGKLKNAAVLMFGKDPQYYFPGVQFKIGSFGADDTDLIFQDIIEGNILQMADKVIWALRTKYFRNPIRYVGMQRIEDLEIPEEALREIIYNAIIHKQYSGVPIQMRVYNDHIELWNNGELPDTLTAEKLMQKHSSYPRNLSIAGVFLAAGFIESWGRGIEKICSGFKNAKINNPIFEAVQGGVRVTFERNSAIKGQSDPINDPINDPKVAHAELTDRQLNILNIIEQNPNVSRKELTQKLLVSDATIKRDLQVMQKKGIISRIGGRKTGQWVIIK